MGTRNSVIITSMRLRGVMLILFLLFGRHGRYIEHINTRLFWIRKDDTCGSLRKEPVCNRRWLHTGRACQVNYLIIADMCHVCSFLNRVRLRSQLVDQAKPQSLRSGPYLAAQNEIRAGGQPIAAPGFDCAIKTLFDHLDLAHGSIPWRTP